MFMLGPWVAWVILVGLVIWLRRENQRRDDLISRLEEHRQHLRDELLRLQERVGRLEQAERHRSTHAPGTAQPVAGEAGAGTAAAPGSQDGSVRVSLPRAAPQPVGAAAPQLPEAPGQPAAQGQPQQLLPQQDQPPRQVRPPPLPAWTREEEPQAAGAGTLAQFLEEWVGPRLLAWLGGLALFVGAILALQWSIESGLVPPAVRVAAGYAVALALAGSSGWRRIQGIAPWTAGALGGAGVLIGYGTTYAAHWLYRLPVFDAAMTVGVSTGWTVMGAVLAGRWRQQSAAWLSLIGGYIMPLLVYWREADGSHLLAAYTLVLTLGALVLAVRRGWGGHGLAAAGLQAIFTVAIAMGARDAEFWLAWPAVAAVAVGVVGMRLESRVRAGARSGSTIGVVLAAGAMLRLFLGGGYATPDLLVLGGALVMIILIWEVARRCGWMGTDVGWLAQPMGALVWLAWVGNPWLGWVPLAMVLAALAVVHDAAVWLAWCRGAEEESRTRLLMDLVLPFGMMFVLAVEKVPGWPAQVEFLWLGLGLLALGVARDINRPGCRSPLVRVALWALVAAIVIKKDPAIEWLLPVGSAWLLTLGWALVRLRRGGTGVSDWLIGALTGPAHYFLLLPVVKAAWPALPAWVWPVAASVYAGLLLVLVSNLVREEEPGRRGMLSWFGGVLAGFLALTIPDIFGREGRLVGWAFQGAVFAALARRRPEPWVCGSAVVLLAGVVGLVMGRDLMGESERGLTAGWGPYVVTHVVLVAALAVAAAVHWRNAVQQMAKDLARWAAASAGGIAFLLAHLLLADFFQPAGDRKLLLLPTVTFGHGMAVTILWAGTGLLLLVLGNRHRHRPLRVTGVVLVLAALAKLFLSDLAGLGALPRVGAFIGVAAIALVASYLLRAGKESQKSPGPQDPPAPPAPQ